MKPSIDQRKKKVLIELNIVCSVKIMGCRAWLENFVSAWCCRLDDREKPLG